MRTDKAALGLALVSIAMNVVLIIKRPNVPAVVDSSSQYEARISRLTQEIAVLRGKLDQVDQRVRVTTAPTLPNTEPDPVEAQVASGGAPTHPEDPSQPPPYVKFHTSSSAITVRQSTTGAMVVENTDPALTGTTITINADYASGKSESIDVVVPAPNN